MTALTGDADSDGNWPTRSEVLRSDSYPSVVGQEAVPLVFPSPRAADSAWRERHHK